MADSSCKILASLISLFETLDPEECRTLIGVLENGEKATAGRSRESFAVVGVSANQEPDVIGVFHSAETAIKIARRFCRPDTEWSADLTGTEVNVEPGRFSRVIFEATGNGEKDQTSLVYSSADRIRVVAFLRRPDFPPAEGKPDLQECACCGGYREKLPTIWFGRRVCVLCGFKLQDWARDLPAEVADVEKKMDAGLMSWKSLYTLVFSDFGAEPNEVEGVTIFEGSELSVPNEEPKTEPSQPGEVSAGEDGSQALLYLKNLPPRASVSGRFETATKSLLLSPGKSETPRLKADSPSFVPRPAVSPFRSTVEWDDGSETNQNADELEGHTLDSGSESDTPEGEWDPSDAEGEIYVEEDEDNDVRSEESPEAMCFICEIPLTDETAHFVSCAEEDCDGEAVVCRKCCAHLDTTQGRCLDCWTYYSRKEHVESNDRSGDADESLEDAEAEDGVVVDAEDEIIFSDDPSAASEREPKKQVSLRKFLKLAKKAYPKQAQSLEFDRKTLILTSGHRSHTLSKKGGVTHFRFHHEDCEVFYENKKWMVIHDLEL